MFHGFVVNKESESDHCGRFGIVLHLVTRGFGGNWLVRPQNIKIFENECDVRNQLIKKQQDQSMEKKNDIKRKTGHPNVYH